MLSCNLSISYKRCFLYSSKLKAIPVGTSDLISKSLMSFFFTKFLKESYLFKKKVSMSSVSALPLLLSKNSVTNITLKCL